MTRNEFIANNRQLMDDIKESDIDTADMPGIQKPGEDVAFAIIMDMMSDYPTSKDRYDVKYTTEYDWDKIVAEYKELIAV